MNDILPKAAGVAFGLLLGTICVIGTVLQFRTGDAFAPFTAIFAIVLLLSSTIGLAFKFDPASLVHRYIRANYRD